MSLLNDASLLITPNAYKQGKLYSVIPSNGNGDFSVTRATTATRVNAAGLVELVPYNLVQYSEQFNNAAWTKSAGGASTIAVTPNFATAPNGTLTAERVQMTRDAAGFSQVVQSVSVTSGQSYTFSVYLKALSGTPTIMMGSYGGTNAQTVTLTNEWVRYTWTATSPSTSAFGMLMIWGGIGSTSLSADFLAWGYQLNEGSALDYQATETRLNIPRLDYSLGSCPNILLEPQRTNLALRSEEFDNATWQNVIGGTGVNSTRVANAVISPSGIQNADTITLNRGSGNTISDFSFIFQSVTLVSSLYTLSFWIKANSPSEIGKTLMARVVGANISNQLITLTSSWQRFTFTSTATATAGVTGIDFYNRGTLTTGNSVTFDIWGAQLEAGAYATSYIPTTSASVTRNADVISRGNIFTNGLITASGGTWFVDLRNNIPRTRESSSAGVPYLGDSNSAGVGNNFRILGFTASRYLIQKFVAGVATTIHITTSNTSKIAIKWNGTTADVFENGVKVVTATSFTATALDFLAFRTEQVLFNINSMALFPTPLTDTQCIALTT